MRGLPKWFGLAKATSVLSEWTSCFWRSVFASRRHRWRKKGVATYRPWGDMLELRIVPAACSAQFLPYSQVFESDQSIEYTVAPDSDLAGQTFQVQCQLVDWYGSGHVYTSWVLNFDGNSPELTFTYHWTDDDDVERNALMNLVLTSSSFTNGSMQYCTGYLDDDCILRIKDADPVDEEGTSVFIVEREGYVGATVNVQYKTELDVDVDLQHRAEGGTDYTSIPMTTLTIAPDERDRPIEVVTLPDSTKEEPETFLASLYSATTSKGSVTIQRQTGVGTIDDVTSAVTISISDAIPVVEGQGSRFNVTLDGYLKDNQTVTVYYSTQRHDTGAHPAEPDVDFTSKSSSFTFFAGQTTLPIDIGTLTDNLIESDETFKVVLLSVSASSGVAVSIVQNAGIGAITDDTTIEDFWIDDASVLEGTQAAQPVNGSNLNPTLMTFAVHRKIIQGQNTTTATVNYTTQFHTGGVHPASNGVSFPPDYSGPVANNVPAAEESGTLTFGSGVTVQYIDVRVWPDDIYEYNETFLVKLSGAQHSPSGGTVTIVDDTAIGTIIDDDFAPQVEFSRANYSFTETETASIAVELHPHFQANKYTIGTGDASTQFSMRINDKVVSVQWAGSAAGTASNWVALLAASTYPEFQEITWTTPTPADGSVTGREKKARKQVAAVASISAGSGTVSTTPVLITAQRPVTVQYYTTGSDGISTAVGWGNGNVADPELEAGPPNAKDNPLAQRNVDFVETSGSLTFDVGMSTRTFTVPIIDDKFSEGLEDVQLFLRNPVNAAKGLPWYANLTIQDDPLDGTQYENNGPFGQISKVTYAAEVYAGSGSAEVATRIFGYNSTTGNRTSIIDENGKYTGFLYNSAGNLTQITDPDGVISTYGYSTEGLLTTITEAAPGFGESQSVTTFQYTTPLLNEYPWITRVINADGTKRDVDYKVDVVGTNRSYFYGNITSVRSEVGGSTTYYYGTTELGKRTGVIYPLSTFTGFAFDSGNNLSQVSEPLGRVANYVFDSSGRLTEVTREDTAKTVYQYNSVGQVTLVVDPMQYWTTYTYSNGRLASIVRPDPDGAVGPLPTLTTGYTYVDTGSTHTVTVTAPSGAAQVLSYNNRGWLIRSEEPSPLAQGLRPATVYTYDKMGNRRSIQTPDGALRSTTYTDGNRPWEEIDANGTRTTMAYDDRGRVTQAITQVTQGFNGPLVFNNDEEYRYDSRNRLTKTFDLLGAGTFRFYNGLGEAYFEADSTGEHTGRRFDSAGREFMTANTLGNRSISAFNAADEITATADPFGRVFNYRYDNASRRTSAWTSFGSTVGYSESETYSPNDEQTGEANTFGSAIIRWDRAGRLTESVDPYGKSTFTKYDAGGRVTEVIDRNGKSTTTTYDAFDRVTSVQDVQNNFTTYLYDNAFNRVTETQTPLRRVYTLYDSQGRVTKTTTKDATGTTLLTITTTGYDSLGRVATTGDEYGHTTTYVYDIYGRQTEVITTLPTAVGTQLTKSSFTFYDNQGRVTRQVDELGNATETKYNSINQVTATIDRHSNRTTMVYDGYGRVTEVQTKPIQYLSTSAPYLTTRYEYDGRNRLTKTIDVLNHETRTAYNDLDQVTATYDGLNWPTETFYDTFGNVTKVKNAEGGFSYTSYDYAWGWVTQTTDERSNPTGFFYDTFGRVTRVKNALNQETTTTYDNFDRVVTVTTPVATTTNQYDALGRLTAVVRPLGATTKYAYDVHGKVTLETDPLLRTKSYLYDSFGRRVETTDQYSNPNRTTTTYDNFDRVIAVREPSAIGQTTPSITSTVYDQFSRVTEVIDAKGGRTTYGYDQLDRRISVKDSDNNLTTFGYDALGNKIVQQAPATTANPVRLTTFGYDAANQLTNVIDSLGRRRSMSYDKIGRKTSEVWIAADGVSVVDRLTFTYDAINQTQAQNGAGLYSLTYDALNRVVNVQEPVGGGVLLTFAYDTGGRRTSVTDALGTGGTKTTASSYDALGRLTQRQYTFGSVTPRVSRTYDVAGNVSYQRYYNNVSAGASAWTVSSTYTYDRNNRVSFFYLTKNGSTSVVAQRYYAYDPQGRLSYTQAYDTNQITTLTYDQIDQLIQFRGSIGPTVDYVYDIEGNRLTMSSTVNNVTTTTTYNPNSGGDYVDNQLIFDGLWSYTYDAEGNVTRKDKPGENWQYGYDHLNHMTTAKHTTGATVDMRATYTYDAWGNRIKSSVDADGDGAGAAVVTQYVLDGWNPSKPQGVGLENFDVVADLDGAGALKTRYLRGDVVDQLFGRVDYSGSTGTLKWAVTDYLGSVIKVMDTSANFLDSITYDYFGAITSESNSAERGRYAWTGREYHAETKLQYNRARYYDPALGRWTTRDPLGFDAGDTNLYRYVNNSPANSVDPSGMDDEIIIVNDWNASKKSMSRGELRHLSEKYKLANGYYDGPMAAFKPEFLKTDFEKGMEEENIFASQSTFARRMTKVAKERYAFVGEIYDDLTRDGPHVQKEHPPLTQKELRELFRNGVDAKAKLEQDLLGLLEFPIAQYKLQMAGWAYSQENTPENRKALQGALLRSTRATNNAGLSLLFSIAEGTVTAGVEQSLAGAMSSSTNAMWARNAAIPRVRRVTASSGLAQRLQDIGGLPRSSQTIVLMETEGPTILTTGGAQLTEGQLTFARQQGLHVGPWAEGFHGEVLAWEAAGELNVMPTRGVTTNRMCIDGPFSCYEQLRDFSGRLGYTVHISSDGRSFEILPTNR